jgi:DNA-binding CsgD family transcriptional regulator
MMVGRDHELRQLAQLVTAPRSQVAIIAGEPGIGKTRLVHELLAAVPDDTLVFVGHAEPGSLARPYELLLDALAGHDHGTHQLAIDELTDASRSAVERLHTGLRLIGDLTEGQPSVIVFEDLHWADSESAALFERIADAPGQRLLVGTYRPDEVTRRHPVSGLLARMERRHEVTHLRLDRLAPPESATLLASATGEPVPYRTAMELHQRTGGNPFFLEELLRSAATTESGAVDITALCEQPLPWSIAEVLHRQIDGLDAEPRRIVEAAAMLGHRVPFDLLATVTATSEDDLIPALRALVEQGVLVESDDDEFTFRHALVREALTEHLLGRQKRRLHEAALDALLAGSADPALVAHHAKGAGRYADMVTAARRGAAIYLDIGSPYQALQLAEMGLEEAADDTEMLGYATHAAWLAGLVEDATDHAHRWLASAAGPTDRAAALYSLVRLTWDADNYDEMAQLTGDIEALVAELPPGADQAKAMAAVAQSAMLQDEFDKAIDWADRAIALAEQFDLPQIRLAALVEKGASLTNLTSTAQAGREILAGLVDEAEKRGEWLLAARALNNLAQSQPPGSLTEHAEQLERMRVDAERAGHEATAVAVYFQGRARVAMHEGDLDAAISSLEDGRRRDRGYLRRGRRADYHAVFLAGLYLEAGDFDAVADIVESLAAVPKQAPMTIPGLAFHLACRRGDITLAQTLLSAVLDATAVQGWHGQDMAHDLVAAALFAGLPIDRISKLAEALLPRDTWEPWRIMVDAQLAEACGQAAAALPGYASVADSGALAPAVRGTAEVGQARCLLALGRIDEAQAHVRLASELLAKWSGWRRAEVDSLRDRLGLAPTGQAAGEPALTPREREVALLLADGLTNAELARRLYISPKTAAVHVSNILRKLAVASRTEVAAHIAVR